MDLDWKINNFYAVMTEKNDWIIQTLLPTDATAVLDVQRQCYGEPFLEPHALYQRRLQTAGHCCLGVHAQGQLIGYLAAYWSRPGYITPLHGDFIDHRDPSVLYVHDMAILPAAKGQGLASMLLAFARRQAVQRHIRHTALIAVQGSQVYWQRQGYRAEVVQQPQQQANLLSYGADAIYMVGEI